MQADIKKRLLDNLDRILVERRKLVARQTREGFIYYDSQDAYRIITLARAAVERITGNNSAYMRQIEDALKRSGLDSDKMDMILGVIQSLRSDIEFDSLQSVTELIHGDLFGDFLEMARHLVEEGYKDPAAVVAGSSLEAHLRQLCNKSNISTETTTQNGVRPKKADQLNADLANASVYSRLDQKNVTAWLDLRNKAAHGKYNEYSKDQVALLVAGVQDFITRNPA